jgi:hypothetical protein
MKNAYNILVGEPENSKYLGIDGRIILKWIKRKQGWWM